MWPKLFVPSGISEYEKVLSVYSFYLQKQSNLFTPKIETPQPMLLYYIYILLTSVSQDI